MADDSPQQSGSTPADKKSAPRKSYFWKDAWRFLLFLGPLILASWLLNQHFHLDEIRSMEDLGRVTVEMRDALHPDDSLSAQIWSYAYFLLGAAFLSTVGLPRWMICAVGGMVYGAVLGTALSTIGTVVGAILSYLMGGSLLKSTVKRRVGSRWESFSRKFREDGFGYTLHLRLLPGSPGLLTNLLAGACRVRLADYTLATILGYLPKTLMICLLASGAIKSNPWQLSMAIGLYVAFSLAHIAWKRRRKAAGEPTEEEAAS